MPRTGASRPGRLSSGLLPKCPTAMLQMLVIKDFIPDETFDASLGVADSIGAERITRDDVLTQVKTLHGHHRLDRLTALCQCSPGPRGQVSSSATAPVGPRPGSTGTACCNLSSATRSAGPSQQLPPGGTTPFRQLEEALTQWAWPAPPCRGVRTRREGRDALYADSARVLLREDVEQSSQDVLRPCHRVPPAAPILASASCVA